MYRNREIRMILLGKSGAGKSRTANSIVGDVNCFNCEPSAGPVTQTCQTESRDRFRRRLTVVDTPGIFNSRENQDKFEEEIKNSMLMLSPGPHAVLLCSPTLRFGQEDIDILDIYIQRFGVEVFPYVIIVFTHFDIWKNGWKAAGRINADINRYVSQLPEQFKKIVLQCRYIPFDNTCEGSEMEEQVQTLLTSIDEMVRSNGGRNYTNEKFEEIEKKLKAGKKWDEIKKHITLENFGKAIGVVAAIGIGIAKAKTMLP